MLDEWEDEQAIYNLLIHASLIPEGNWTRAINRALLSREQPFFVLAAVVGLQGTDPANIPDPFIATWFTQIMELVRTDGGVLGSRASVTITNWRKKYNCKYYIGLYPVPNNTASKNIIRFTLSKFGDLLRNEFSGILEQCRLDASGREQFLAEYGKYHAEIEEKGFSSRRWQLYSYIPNYIEFKTE